MWTSITRSKGPSLRPEHGLSEVLAGDDAAGIAQQGFKQRELDAGQIEWNAIQRHFAGSRVEPEITDDDYAAGSIRSRGPAKNCSDTCDQFAGVKRLGQVVIRADLETENTINVFTARGEDEHRDG